MISSSRSVPGRPGGQGGKLTSPQKRADVPRTCGRAQISRIVAIAASASAALQARRSISANARSATTLGRSPPRTVPTLIVVPLSRSVRACSVVGAAVVIHQTRQELDLLVAPAVEAVQEVAHRAMVP